MTEETGDPRASARGATTDGRRRQGAVGPVARGATLLAVLMVSFSLPACDRSEPGDPAGTAAGFAVRDSAGIEIVENHFPVYPPERFWRMDMEPEIVLGGSDRWLAGDSAHLIWRVSGLALLEDGRVAVLSRGNRQLYLFEPSGELSRVMGGAGWGPGEFGEPAELQYLSPDTLAVWDSWFGPVSYFDTDGDLIRTRSVDLGKVIAGANRVTSESRRIPLVDGSFVTIVSRGDVPLRPLVGTAFRQPIEILRVDREYAARSLGVWEGREVVAMDVRIQNRPGRWPLSIFSDVFLAVGADPAAIYVAEGTKDEIRQFSLGGKLARIIRRSTAPLPVSDEGHRAWLTYLATAQGLGGRDLVEPLLRATPRRDFHPPSQACLWTPRDTCGSPGGLGRRWGDPTGGASSARKDGGSECSRRQDWKCRAAGVARAGWEPTCSSPFDATSWAGSGWKATGSVVGIDGAPVMPAA